MSEAETILGLLRADLLASVGLALETRMRIVSAEEQREQDLKFDAMLNDPNTPTTVLLGSATPRLHARPLGEYESYWALEMPSRLSLIADA